MYQKIIVSYDDAGQRLDRYLRRVCPDVSYVLTQKLLRKGAIRVNGKRVSGDTRLDAGAEIHLPATFDQIQSQTPDEKEEKIRSHFDIQEMVLYMDDHIIALSKPPGLPVQGGSGLKIHLEMLTDELAVHGVKPRLVHRIDKETSGVLILARKASVARDLTQQFRERDIKKIYIAAVSPAPKKDDGRITAKLKKATSGTDLEKMIVAPDGQTADTSYKTIYKSDDGQYAFVAFYPKTGRTHQIRAHAGYIHSPLLGDPKYGGTSDIFKKLKIHRRVMLHAYAITFMHPHTEQEITIKADIPNDMQILSEYIGADLKKMDVLKDMGDMDA